LFSELDSQLTTALEDQKIITYRFHAMDDNVESKLDFIIGKVINYYDKPEDYQTFLYTVIKELVINGLKANYKRIFFHENQLEIYDEKAYEAGIKEYIPKQLEIVLLRFFQNSAGRHILSGMTKKKDIL
jgi:hypothetical protein